MEFTLKTYENFLKTLSENEIPVYGIGDWIKLKPSRGIMLRHDVDRKAKKSLKIAIPEDRYGIHSTYYFRIVKASFKSDIIRIIRSLGHEIGYHYEDLSLAKGNYEKAVKLFEKHLTKIRSIASVKTISMHGRPLSPYDNRDLWEKYNFEDYGVLAEAFLSVDYSDMYYFTDTGRSWSNNSVNLRDKVKSNLDFELKNTNDLIEFILNNRSSKIAIITHPERWSDGFFEHCFDYLKDSMINLIKKALKRIRKNAV